MSDLPPQVLRLVDLALEEDLGDGDLTSEAILEPNTAGRAVIEARQDLVCCGLEVARAVFERIDTKVMFRARAADGDDVAAGGVMVEMEGPMRALLAGERTALNFLQRMCGVASQSRRYALLAAGRTTILDSRKTVPGWRWLDKLAVRAGGCTNHRMGLYDGVLIKDNHIAACGGITEAVTRARSGIQPGIAIEVEVEDMMGLEEAIEAGADIVMLDNFSPVAVGRAARASGGAARLEVSGGIDLENIEDYLQAARVDYISVGALTHSVMSADVAMEIVLDENR